MNAALKIKIARYLMILASIAGIVQTMLTSPPYTPEQVQFWTATLVYVALVATAWKQYLSPEIRNVAGNVTIVVAILATVTGFLDYIRVLHFTNATAERIKWWVTVVIAVFNLLSKDIFPSEMQKDRVVELKQQ